MSKPFVRVDLGDKSPDFQRIALEPGVPLLDRAQATGRLLRVWLGRLIAEPEWVDAETVQFYVTDDQARRIAVAKVRPVRVRDLSGRLKAELQAMRDRLQQAKPRGRTEEAMAALLRDRWNALIQDPKAACNEGSLYCYQDAGNRWRLVWCWGYQRRQSKPAAAVLCPNVECLRAYLVKAGAEGHCPRCQTPMPVYRFPWRRVIWTAVCGLALVGSAGGWYWYNLPRSIIKGQVQWSDQPVANAEVRIAGSSASTRTDAQGRFRLERLPAGLLTVSVAADGLASFEQAQRLERKQDVNLAIELVGDGILFGRVVDAVSRKPIPGAHVDLDGASLSLTCDDDGCFRHDACRRGEIPLKVSAAGYPELSQSFNVTSEVVSRDLALTGEALLLGQVLSAAKDEPLPGVTVQLEGAGQSTRTDPDGRFVFRQAPAGRQRLVVEHDGFARQDIDKDLVSGQERYQSIRLSGAANLMGTITRKIDSAPLLGALVRVVGTKFAAQTDEDGHFTLRGLSAGRTNIEIEAPGYAQEMVERELSSSDDNSLTVALSGNAALVGQVTDGLLQTPVAGAEVRLAGSPFQTKTDATGKYRLDAVPSLKARLDVRQSGYVPQPIEVQPPANQALTADVVLMGAGAVAGAVIERWSETPISGARLTIAQTELKRVTADDGTFEIKGLRGGVRHELEIAAEGWPRRTESVEAVATPKKITIALTGDGRLTGQVRSARDDQPLAGATIRLAKTKHSVATDADGRFVLDQLRHGPATIDIAATGFQPQRKLETVAAETKPLTVQLGGDAVVVGRVIDIATQLPLENVQVRILETALKAITDKDGQYRLAGAFAEPAKLSAIAAGYPAVDAAAELLSEQETTVDLSLVGTGAVRGEILDDQNRPLPGADIRLASTDYRVKSNNQGEFELPRLRAGPLSLEISAATFASETRPADVRLGEKTSIGRVSLAKSLTVRGQALHALTGKPVPDVRVSVDNSAVSNATDADGRFQLDGLPAKRLLLRLQASGFVADHLAIEPTTDLQLDPYLLCPQPQEREILLVATWLPRMGSMEGHLYRLQNGAAAAHVSAATRQAENLALVNSGDGWATLRLSTTQPGRYEFLLSALPTRDAQGKISPSPLSTTRPQVRVFRAGMSEPQAFIASAKKQFTVWQPFALEVVTPVRIIDHVYKAEHYSVTLPPEIAGPNPPR